MLAPTGRDAPLAVEVLQKHAISACVVDDMDHLLDSISDGVGAVLIAEEALDSKNREGFLGALEMQPVWSDVPVLLLVAKGGDGRTMKPAVREVVARGNVTLLDRPVRVATLTTAIGAALRARARQYEIRDAIIDRARSEETQRILRREAEEANKAKMRFLATMSHELRTPLNAIGGHLQLVQLGIHGPVTPEQSAALERVRRAEFHLLGLINDVLNFAKIEAGHVTFDLKPTTIGALFDGLDALIEPQVEAKGLTYARQAGCDEFQIMADMEKARQIILNLLSNAVKFTPEGGHIAIQCREEEGVVAVDVTDNGIGVSAHELASIFEPFVQVRPTLTARNEGTGLGLAISRDLARAMNGDISARSETGKGSTFTLTLPRLGQT